MCGSDFSNAERKRCWKAIRCIRKVSRTSHEILSSLKSLADSRIKCFKGTPKPVVDNGRFPLVESNIEDIG